VSIRKDQMTMSNVGIFPRMLLRIKQETPGIENIYIVIQTETRIMFIVVVVNC